MSRSYDLRDLCNLYLGLSMIAFRTTINSFPHYFDNPARYLDRAAKVVSCSASVSSIPPTSITSDY